MVLRIAGGMVLQVSELIQVGDNPNLEESRNWLVMTEVYVEQM